jgi:asparagine synthase (glutamine-hydrolysing)
MCGILGVLDIKRLRDGAEWSSGERSRFDDLRDTMSSRGPDGAGSWVASGIMLGHRRLAILDLSESAAQPIVSAAGTVLIFNGEIYNYRELRAELESTGSRFASTGDTVVLLEALDRWGLEKTLARIRGMFAFAAWRPRQREIWLARDPVGKKPLFCGRFGDVIAFGSSVEPILAWLVGAGLDPQLDPVAVHHVLAVGYVPAPRTGIVGIEKLPAATYRVIKDDGDVRAGCHWTIPFANPGRKLNSTSVSELASLFDQAIDRRLLSDVPIATFLSGGLDSSLVTAAAARKYDRLVAYTVRTRDNNDDEFDLACRLARHLGVEHRIIESKASALEEIDHLVPRFGEPFADSSALPTAAICREAGRDHHVILTGDGGDEVQGGYSGAPMFAIRSLLWQKDRSAMAGTEPVRARLADWMDNPDRRLVGGLGSLRFRLLRLLSPIARAIVLRSDGLESSARFLQADCRSGIAHDEWCQWVDRRLSSFQSRNGLDAHLAFDFAVYLADDLNTKVDVAAMASSVETRAPLLDVDFVSACWGIRALDRVRPWERKRIIVALARRFLPDELLIRRKQGFSVPLASWLAEAGQAGPLVLGGLSDRLREMLDLAAIEQVLVANQAARRPPTELTWRLLVLGVWSRWVDRVAADVRASKT